MVSEQEKLLTLLKYQPDLTINDINQLAEEFDTIEHPCGSLNEYVEYSYQLYLEEMEEENDDGGTIHESGGR